MILIRQETSQDQKEVYSVNAFAFKREDESKLINKLRSTEHFIPELSLVAVDDERIVGHILFTKIHVKAKDEVYQVLSLAPMSVLPEYQGKGIGQKLIHQGLASARKIGYPAVLVLGHPKYYPKAGFKKASNWKIQCPFPAPDEAWMALELLPNGLAQKEGVAVFPDVFNEV